MRVIRTILLVKHYCCYNTTMIMKQLDTNSDDATGNDDYDYDTTTMIEMTTLLHLIKTIQILIMITMKTIQILIMIMITKITMIRTLWVDLKLVNILRRGLSMGGGSLMWSAKRACQA